MIPTILQINFQFLSNSKITLFKNIQHQVARDGILKEGAGGEGKTEQENDMRRKEIKEEVSHSQ